MLHAPIAPQQGKAAQALQLSAGVQLPEMEHSGREEEPGGGRGRAVRHVQKQEGREAGAAAGDSAPPAPRPRPGAHLPGSLQLFSPHRPKDLVRKVP